MDLTNQSNFVATLLKVPFARRWDLLKHEIERLYVTEGRPLSDVASILNKNYKFDADATQYKYQIKKWKLKKSTSSVKKEKLYRVVKQRAQQDKATVFTQGGRKADTKNLVRYIKSRTRDEIELRPSGSSDSSDSEWMSVHFSRQFGYRIFMNWNMPYGAMIPSSMIVGDHVSPLSDFTVTTPASHGDAPSPVALAPRSIRAAEGTKLFVEGRHNELLQSLDRKQRVVMSTWMYQFWLFSFKTAKHWGRGPQRWTADMLRFEDFKQGKTVSGSIPDTPGGSVATPVTHSTPQESATPASGMEVELQPSSLCRWSVHCNEVEYTSERDPPRSSSEHFDLDNEESWSSWPRTADVSEFAQKLTDGVRDNSFSNLKASEIPIETRQLASAVHRSPEELFKESLGFCIMGRNEEVLIELLHKNSDLVETGLYPFHLALTYFDGSRSCCNILETLVDFSPTSVRKLHVNELGHTLIDQLMLCILKSHTSCSPSTVDDIFKLDRRFEGEDVSMCGRWDADSDCIRNLLAQGIPTIPFGWKHMFCHTSAQAICHCISTIFGPRWRPNIDNPSGLFTKRCVHCGMKLQLLPLHTLLLVALQLSEAGCENENLFGILACLLCLLHNNADPLLTSEISLKALIGDEDPNNCSHQELNPLQLARQIVLRFSKIWSEEINLGWHILCNVLDLAQTAARTEDDSERDEDEELHYSASAFAALVASNGDEVPLPCSSKWEGHDHGSQRHKILGSLWAAVQVELLTYRRLSENDPWISPHFDLMILDRDLDNGEVPSIALLRRGMMKPFCRCGNFGEAVPASATISEVSAYHFSNLEDWNRSTFIRNHDHRVQSWFDY